MIAFICGIIVQMSYVIDIQCDMSYVNSLIWKTNLCFMI